MKTLTLWVAMLPIGLFLVGCEDEAEPPARGRNTTTRSAPSRSGVGNISITTRIRDTYLQGDYGAVIKDVTRHLENDRQAKERPNNAAAPDEDVGLRTRRRMPERMRRQLLYFRGRAAHALGSYDAAQSDLAPLGDFKLYSNWKSASDALAESHAMEAMIPPHSKEVRDEAGNILFRVHYERADPFTKAVIALLPRAYQANKTMLGVDQQETPVYIFNDYNRFQKFYYATNRRFPDKWLRAYGGRAGFFIYQTRNAGVPLVLQSGHFRAMVGHEFNHCMASRLYGTTLPPEWMREGLAEVAGCGMAPGRRNWIEHRMAQIVAAGHIVPLADLTENFKGIMGANSDARRKDIPAPDPYAQGYSMTRFFLNSIKQGALSDFLVEVRISRDFRKTFQKYTRQTPEKFYNAWLAQVTRRRDR